jgi:hypothetical protein
MDQVSMRRHAEGRLESTSQAEAIHAADAGQVVQTDILVKVRMQILTGAQGHGRDLCVALRALAPAEAA